MIEAEVYEAMKYFKSFDEGDNITITCDFIMNIDFLINYINILEEELKQSNKSIEYWASKYKELLKEQKKIPEKIPYYSMEKIQKAKNKDEWREERISLLEKRVEDLHIKMNDLLDYLKSKGE